MRPLRLELKGFTAFREAQEIDFEGLDLFAISGPTGSGKTSILDAITYALFGTIERVGRQAAQFVSQGQTRLAVTFDFAVDDQRYRVTRSTPSKGATKILLERWDGTGWRQAGEGADRVREANQLIEAAVGLDFDGFTRSVLLPQGRFAEFLVGDSKQRRDILTDLLGLELFERLGKRAGELERAADAEARAKTALLESEYAGVTPDAVAEAETAAKAAAARDEALAAAEATVRDLSARWADVERAVRDLRGCGRDAREAGSVAAAAADALEGLAERSAESDALVEGRAAAVVRAEKAAERAARAHENAEQRWGRVADLVRLHAKAERLEEARATGAEIDAEVETATRERPRLEKALEAAATRLKRVTAKAEGALEALEVATTALDEAKHADLVAAVGAVLRVGDECPVCGAKVTTLRRAAGVVPVERAAARLEKARAAAASGDEALATARRAADAAAAELNAVGEQISRREAERSKAAKETAALEAEIAGALGGRLPADALEAIDERLERLEALVEEARTAGEETVRARAALVDAERARDRLVAEIAEARGRVEALAVSGLLERATDAVGEEALEVDVPPVERAEDPGALAASARGTSDGLSALADRLEALAIERGEGEARAIAEAAEALEGLVELGRAGSVADVMDAVSAERTRAARSAQTAHDRVEQARARLANVAAIVEQSAEQRARADVFHGLAQELRADRLIAFLQVEALQVLAAAGSERLSMLSTGRYRLEFDEDEFFVVDTWNGEERRSARTLSGGETFLASLALALALSEQVRSLAVTDKARLDSLFLDEGFGTLDPETLEVVVDAIEQLGGDGRMVGVITHVQELAIRLPARVEVEKSPRGSRLRIVA